MTREEKALAAQLRFTMNARRRGEKVTGKEHRAVGDAARIVAEGSGPPVLAGLMRAILED